MNSLAADLEEFEGDEKGRRFVRRLRNDRCIYPDEGSCWFVEVQQDYYEEGTRRVSHSDYHTVWLGSSPADAVTFARLYADARAARQDGLGRWTLEVHGDGLNAPTLLVVYPRPDPEAP